MYLIYLTLSILGLVAFVIAAVIKGEEIKKNLFFVFTGSLFVGTSYLFTATGINGAVSSFIGATQAIINYFYNQKKKKIPMWLILVYVLLFLGLNIALINSPIGIFAILASLSFVGSISVKTGKGYRAWQAINGLLWIIYDVLSHSYGPLITHLVLFCFTVVGMIMNDYKIKRK